MADLRQMTVTGRVGKAPEMLTSKSGTQYCRVGVANVENRQANGQWESVTLWCQVLLFGKQAEYAVQNLPKGCPVSATGRPSFEVYPAGSDTVQVTLHGGSVQPLLTKKNQALILGAGSQTDGGGGAGFDDDGWD
jgi:single-stranded DNA-binding protein